MDVNETLRQIRELREELFAEGEPYAVDYVRDLLEHVDALDSWLTSGGFLPTEWAR